MLLLLFDRTSSNISSSVIKEKNGVLCSKQNSDLDDNSIIDVNTVTPEKLNYDKRQTSNKGRTKITGFQQSILESLNS